MFMRAKEFITERELSTRVSDTLPLGKYYPDMPSSDPYQAYRFSLAMADHTLNHAEGPASNAALIFAYTKGEEEIIKGGEAQTGKKSKVLTDGGSVEPDSTNKQSPVAKPKRNKYGI